MFMSLWSLVSNFLFCTKIIKKEKGEEKRRRGEEEKRRRGEEEKRRRGDEEMRGLWVQGSAVCYLLLSVH